MKVELGNRGLENSWKEPFPENTACVHGCGGVAIPAVCLMEEPPEDDDYICDLPVAKNKEDEAKMLWPHDATAFAIYLCPKCLEATALFNQA